MKDYCEYLHLRIKDSLVNEGKKVYYITNSLTTIKRERQMALMNTHLIYFLAGSLPFNDISCMLALGLQLVLLYFLVSDANDEEGMNEFYQELSNARV